MVEPINLNRTRKAKTKADATAQAAANRVKFGRTGVQKSAEAFEAKRKAAALDNHKRED